jgi:3-oxoacyl-[acyl-carrier protein] reductase
MQTNLAAKNVLVTGGTRGIGKAMVEAFAAEKANVAFTYRSSSAEADALVATLEAAGVQAIGIQADSANPEAAEQVIAQILEKWGSIDVLVNNAGITRDNLMLKMTHDDWDAVLDTNLKGAFSYCKAVYRPMMKQRSGKIINIASIVGIMGNPGQANYAASKAGLIGFSKSLAKELGARGITVNVVAPGFVATEMTDGLSDAAKDAMLNNVPLKRAASPEDIANATVFLASDAANYITGHVLQVTGGLAM